MCNTSFIFNRGHPFMTSTRMGSGSGGRMWKGDQTPRGRPHKKLKLEFTDVILSSSHAEKLASFFNQNFVFGVEIVCRYVRKVLAVSRVMCISCRLHVDVHKGEEGVWLMWTEDQKSDFFGRHKWIAPYKPSNGYYTKNAR